MNHLLPPNSTKFEQNFSLAFGRVSNIQINTRNFNDPYAALPSALPYLAWERSSDDWDKAWDDEQKRKTVDSAYFVHCHKGTIGALERALGALSFEVRVQEWFNMQPMGTPYTFRLFIDVDQIGISSNEFNRIFKIVNNNKNLRSHFISIGMIVKSTCQIHTAAYVSFGREFNYIHVIGELFLDGTWLLDGSNVLNGNMI